MVLKRWYLNLNILFVSKNIFSESSTFKSQECTMSLEELGIRGISEINLPPLLIHQSFLPHLHVFSIYLALLSSEVDNQGHCI